MITSELISAIQSSRRPIFIWGAGMRSYAEQARELARSLGIPVACTWAAIDLMHHDDQLMAGGFGTHGTRAANFAVQNSDLVLSLGSRLDTKATGFPAHFARSAQICMVDIDVEEIAKFTKLGRKIDFPIFGGDVGKFIAVLDMATNEIHLPYELWFHWTKLIASWRRIYADPQITWPGINPYELMREIAQYTTKDDILCSDTGFALGWTMQAFPFKGERFLHAFNMTPMGYGLPASVGAAFATGRRVILITGDGSLMMSLSELSTVARWQLPIKIVLLNNKGHGMCRQTQRQWLGGSYPATSLEGGLGFPNFLATAKAFGLGDWATLEHLFKDDKPGMCMIPIHPDAQLIPQAKYGQPIEDADPQLPREEFMKQMIVDPI